MPEHPKAAGRRLTRLKLVSGQWLITNMDSRATKESRCPEEKRYWTGLAEPQRGVPHERQQQGIRGQPDP